ncbi:MAG: 1-deoxy-D-xylulose-5-phosphate synthase N-terminal domain-containing protein [Candidatus Omnitrophica bacterium]|nr:1-deoxy-D-xylulose-5-phosphate synthase N-terminal domain-containing protein [Candidatus Omnitrophota bacterium]
MKMTKEQKHLRRRIIEISHEKHLSHLGSCLSAVDILSAIYKIKRDNERLVLSGGHAGIALYAILEKHGLLKTPDIKNLSIHPNRNPAIGIDVSSGSLGQGLPIAVGMALADRRKGVYCVVTDGECAEGSIWESLRIALDERVDNLKIVINVNGWAAYRSVSLSLLCNRVKGFGYNVKPVNGHDMKELLRVLSAQFHGHPLVVLAKTTVEQLPFLNGQDAHYYVMTDADFKLAKERFI